MPHYYTSTSIALGYIDTVPAILFFNSEGELSFEEALEGIRAYIGAPAPMLCQPVDSKGHVGWAFTPSLRMPGAPHTVPDGTLLIADIMATPAVVERLDLREIYRGCTQLSRLMSETDCPCDMRRHPSLADSDCERLVVLPALKIVPVATLLERRQCPEAFVPKAPFKPLAGFTYVSPTLLTDKVGRAVTKQSVGELRLSEAFISARREELSERATNAAATRRLKKSKCNGCLFQGECSTYEVENCGGAKSEGDVLAHVGFYGRGMRVFEWQDPLSFTPEQLYTLLYAAGPTKMWDAYVPQISSRRTHVHLGGFIGDGKFQVVAAVGDRTRTAYFRSWAELKEAVPELEVYRDVAVPAPWQLEAYAAAAYSRYHRQKTGLCWSQWSLTCLHMTDRHVIANYGDARDPSRTSLCMSEHTWSLELFRFSQKQRPFHVLSEHERI